MKDYLRTNRLIQIKPNLTYLGIILKEHSSKFANKIRHYLMAEAEYLNASLDKIEADFGSFEDFF